MRVLKVQLGTSQYELVRVGAVTMDVKLVLLVFALLTLLDTPVLAGETYHILRLLMMTP